MNFGTEVFYELLFPLTKGFLLFRFFQGFLRYVRLFQVGIIYHGNQPPR